MSDHEIENEAGFCINTDGTDEVVLTELGEGGSRDRRRGWVLY